MAETRAIRLTSGRIVVEHPVQCDVPNVTIAEVAPIDKGELSNGEWEEYCRFVAKSKHLTTLRRKMFPR